ncbi:MAG: CPBP family intramembrane metalloprotease [Planctomycetes bacterium]|nr:CPBP family intramembrane metalloprotease [Planctomycetota bacterium]
MSSTGPGDKPSTPVAGRPSAVQPDVKLERRVSPFFALLFYGFLFAAAWVWVPNTGQDAKALWTPRALWLDVVVGLGAGLALVLATPGLTRRVRSLGELEREFGWVLGEQRTWECVVLAIAGGVAEEFFFRGAMLAAAGPWVALAVFAGLHWPINAQWRAWPVTAALAGAVLTGERLLTGTVVAPVITHVMVNLVNLIRISRKYRIWRE